MLFLEHYKLEGIYEKILLYSDIVYLTEIL